MRGSIMAAAICVAFAGTAWAGDDTLIVPGQSVGRITGKTTLGELKATYKKDNVKPQEIHVAEGNTIGGAVVFDSNPKRRLEVAWRDGGQANGVAWVRISGKASDWHTSEGVTLGVGLDKLEKMNGKPFKLYGFSWDFGGTVSSWRGGRLDRALKNVGVTLAATRDNDDPAMRKVMGDKEFASDNPNMKKVSPVVREIIVNLE